MCIRKALRHEPGVRRSHAVAKVDQRVECSSSTSWHKSWAKKFHGIVDP
eukprot:CAMPEP_0175881090 /NCGR_PEP_ID=MMETSP0107_2-20121207/42687_1 /TAXON_ID=195067 ORGANISM="Goniomonas pacifica, Strain CCMP1869" /NCGR_SAMPLE_ID=MMETSP0107_2 /ASSEMBLY_ACC=CAM_ASM_000203 /LENGTH=48 /DNA_ID= /DNA_START= /DNA_END= /DNA_ORIENTATION=